MTYKGKFHPKFPQKYRGDISKITYRSLWERQVFRWCDEKSEVLKWNSEEVVIPYICETDGKWHRYFMDLYVLFENKQEYLIEIKPEKQTIEPKVQQRKTKKYLKEVMTYVKNQSKWRAAKKYADDRGWIFQVWTEKTMKKLGIRLLTSK